MIKLAIPAIKYRKTPLKSLRVVNSSVSKPHRAAFTRRLCRCQSKIIILVRERKIVTAKITQIRVKIIEVYKLICFYSIDGKNIELLLLIIPSKHRRLATRPCLLMSIGRFEITEILITVYLAMDGIKRPWHDSIFCRRFTLRRSQRITRMYYWLQYVITK